MYKRYQGNTGRVEHIEEGARRPQTPPPSRPAPLGGRPAMVNRQARPGLMAQLNRLLPGTREALETEDILLLLILYLLYRESGDSELLMTMGAMFLL